MLQKISGYAPASAAKFSHSLEAQPKCHWSRSNYAVISMTLSPEVWSPDSGGFWYEFFGGKMCSRRMCSSGLNLLSHHWRHRNAGWSLEVQTSSTTLASYRMQPAESLHLPRKDHRRFDFYDPPDTWNARVAASSIFVIWPFRNLHNEVIAL